MVASCHCNRIKITMPSLPTRLNECHCTACYKYGAIWAYFPRNEVRISVADDTKIEAYIRADGDGDLSFNRCSNCGCITHWWGEGEIPEGVEERMGVNCRLVPENEIFGIERTISPGPKRLPPGLAHLRVK
jgi:hypothetical protein